MVRSRSGVPWPHAWPWVQVVVVGLAVALVAIEPAPLLPVARAVGALCERYPVLALVANHAPPLSLALLLSLAGCALLAGSWAGMIGLVATLRFNRRLRRGTRPTPHRVVRIAENLGLASRLTYLADPGPMACCYGFVRPRIAVTAGLTHRLDNEELTAALGHEREHLRRRDPLRYLLVDVLAAAAFMVPVVPVLRERLRTRTELSADRAALAVASRGALAGALLAVIRPAQIPPGIAGLTSTDTRIAQLSGQPQLPPIPARAVVASLGLAGVIVLAMADLAASADLVRMVCPFCSWLQ